MLQWCRNREGHYQAAFHVSGARRRAVVSKVANFWTWQIIDDDGTILAFDDIATLRDAKRIVEQHARKEQGEATP